MDLNGQTHDSFSPILDQISLDKETKNDRKNVTDERYCNTVEVEKTLLGEGDCNA